MSHIEKYTVVEVWYDSRALEAEVNQLIGLGWEPAGDLKVISYTLRDKYENDQTTVIFYQPMVKLKETKNEPDE